MKLRIDSWPYIVVSLVFLAVVVLICFAGYEANDLRHKCEAKGGFLLQGMCLKSDTIKKIDPNAP